jgi:hypothetical protein
MDHLNIEHDIALDHVTTLSIAARAAHAATVCDALEEHRHALSANELHDLAFGAWREFIDFDQPIPQRDVVAVFLRVARFLPEQIAVDLAAETFDADAETWQRFPDGSGLRWMPADELLILSYPTGQRFPSVIEVVLTGGRAVGRI